MAAIAPTSGRRRKSHRQGGQRHAGRPDFAGAGGRLGRLAGTHAALEQDWFAPLLAALKAGSVARVTLMLSHRNGWTTAASTGMAQRKFWRKPSLTC
jgi:hypothetical protein